MSYPAQRFEVPYMLTGKTVRLVGVEDGAGVSLGQAMALDVQANVHRTLRKPEPPEAAGVLNNSAYNGPRSGPNMVELAHAQFDGEKRTTARVSTNNRRGT